ncbi:MAG: hypothetical protein KKG60_03330 [Nanoarchaeota archaeon]|nr:hypothetical protein [Nanoarchaeota archaeon]
MVERISVVFEKAKILGYNRYENSYDLQVTFKINEGVSRVCRNYVVGQAEYVLVDIVNFIKDEIKKKYESNYADDDILSGHVIINLDNLEEFEKKLVVFIRRFYDKVRTFRVDKSADGYINRLFSLKDCEEVF